MKTDRFHGRYESRGRPCEAPGCDEGGEFRAPGNRASSYDGPGDYRWFCLDHVREFNAGYDWFEGMNAEEIRAAQHPVSGWANQSRTFRPDAGIDGMPRWADYDDPLEAISRRASDIKARAASNMPEPSRFTPREREALTVMGLGKEADRTNLRRRYSELVRKYHPDRNGGDRSQERRLQQVVEAYQLLKGSPAFA